MADVILSDFNELRTNLNEPIKVAKECLTTLHEECLKYTEMADTYNQNHLYDVSLLKEKIKSKVIKAVNDEI